MKHWSPRFAFISVVMTAVLGLGGPDLAKADQNTEVKAEPQKAAATKQAEPLGNEILPAPATAEERADIKSVINSQLEAFALDDAETAFAFASPGIQRRFGSPNVFIRMVKSGYSPLISPRQVNFGDAIPSNDRDAIIQKVLVQDNNGLLVDVMYRMVQIQSGEWRIAGCVIRKSNDRAL
ncbi:MAG: DUF4864 domain-containing protein [Pseudomonadota bacterium]